MRAEAESHAEEDRKHLAEIEARNHCDARVYQVEKLLKENREKLSEADIKAVEESLEQCKRALAGDSIEQIKGATEELERSAHRIAETLYRSGAAGGTPGTGAAGSGTPGADAPGQAPKQGTGQGEVIDAEYVDVDDSKKPN